MTIKPMYELNETGGLDLHLHPGQLQAYGSDKRYVIVLAGSQGGKTSFAPIWLYRELLNRGPGDYLFVSPTHDLLKMKALPELRKLFVDTLRIGRYYAANQMIGLINPLTINPTRAEWPDNADSTDFWGRIILRSASSGSGEVGVRGLESATAKAAVLDEAGMDNFTEATWDAVNSRLTIARGRVLVTTTLYNWGFLKTKLYDEWIKAGKNHPYIDVIQFRSDMNPCVSTQELELRRATMPPWKFRMRYEGLYDRPAGVIYGDFNRVSHVIPQLELNSSAPIYVGIDPGAVNTACVFIMHDATHDRYIVFDSTLEGNLTSKEHVARIKQKIINFRGSIRALGGAPSEKQFRLDFNAAGLPVQEPPVKDVEAGIDRVISLLKSNRLLVTDNNVGLIGQFEEYSRELDTRGEPTEKIKDKENYHYLDALRYACCTLDDAAQEFWAVCR